MLTSQQIRWARQHDWFVDDLGDGTITVRDSWVNANTGTSGEALIHWCRTFRELRQWAGY